VELPGAAAALAAGRYTTVGTHSQLKLRMNESPANGSRVQKKKAPRPRYVQEQGSESRHLERKRSSSEMGS
jgi:hypothetical protein